VPSKYTTDFLWVLYDKEQAGCCGQQTLPSKHAIYNPLFDVKYRECHGMLKTVREMLHWDAGLIL